MWPQRQEHAFSLFCVAAPTDTTFLTKLETQFLPFQQAGHLTFWSEQHLEAGALREQELLTHFHQADVIILLLSADFFASQSCLAHMEQALQRQENKGITVIPLLLRPVEWQASPLGVLNCFPANGVPVTQWADQDEALHNCAQSIYRLLGPPSHSSFTLPHAETRSKTKRKRVLLHLYHSLHNLLAQPLEGITWIGLGAVVVIIALVVGNLANFGILSFRVGSQTTPQASLTATVAASQDLYFKSLIKSGLEDPLTGFHGNHGDLRIWTATGDGGTL